MLKNKRGVDHKYILLVPDSLFWVTGRIARELSRKLVKDGSKVIICSGLVLPGLLSRWPDLLEQIGLIHFLTPHLATQFKMIFYEKCVFVSTVHHIENEFSVEPVAYSDAIMTVSHQWHEELVNSGVPSDRLVMLQNGIDTNLFCPAAKNEKQRIRKKLGLPFDAFVVGFSAKRTSDSCDRKGVDVFESLIRTAVKRDMNDIAWFVRGPGWNDLVRSLQDSGIRIVYSPFLVSDKELSESYKALDAFVITSRIEGGPVPLLEGMSSGLPVVTTRVGVAPEIIDDNINGYLVDFNEPNAILGKLHRLSCNRSAANEVGRFARETIVQKLQWKDTVESIGNLYAIAGKNYISRKRIGSDSCAPAPPKHLNISGLRRWIYAEECASFARFLETQGATEPAREMADCAVIHSFFDYRLYKKVEHLINHRKTCKLIAMIREIATKRACLNV